MKKSSNQSGFVHHLVLIIIVVLVVASATFAGYRIYKNRQTVAKATTYTVVSSGTYLKHRSGSPAPTVTIRACTSYTGTDAKGPLYTVKLRFYKNVGEAISEVNVAGTTSISLIPYSNYGNKLYRWGTTDTIMTASIANIRTNGGVMYFIRGNTSTDTMYGGFTPAMIGLGALGLGTC